MSGLFEGDQSRKAQVGVERPGRSRALLITTGVVIVGFLALTGLSSFWTERLWFDSLGYESVFSRLVWTRVLLFVGFGAVMAGSVAASMMLAFRLRPIFRPASPEQTSLDRYRETVTPIRRWLVLGVCLVVGAFAGTSAAGEWRTFMLWRNAVPFEAEDPYFSRDIGFYVFSLPWMHFVVGFVMALAVVSLLAAGVVHYLYGGIRLQATHDRISGAAATHLSVLAGVFMLAKGADYYLDRFDILTSSGNLIDGMSYTDDNAVLPAKNILMGIVVVCAVLFFVNVWRRTWMLPTVGVGLWVLSSILLGLIWPGIVQQFQVDPSEADREEPYIQENIIATRQAFDLEQIEIVEDPSQAAEAATLTQLSASTSQVPLIDPELVRDNFEQQQQQQAYYSLAPVLDVDRYQVGEQERALVLGVRELDQSGLAESNQNWSNLHTVFTHGYGLIAAFGNQRDTDNEAAPFTDLAFAEQGLPPSGVLSDQSESGYEARIYFGEQSPDYSIVGKADGGQDVEFDRPLSEEEGSTTTYDGRDGVGVGGLWRQLLYAVKFGDPNIVLSSRVNDNSRIIYERNPADRVRKVAPWLSIDQDPYPAVVDGKVVWILDGYTFTDRYPLSDKQSYEEMTDDSLPEVTQFQALPTDELNYMRNAVKATVDAYDGTVTLYEWDETDPLLRAWMGAFPGTVQAKSEISEELLAHLRYPEDMFKVQRYQFARYHVADADQWYEGDDRWQVPRDPYQDSNYQPPYRMLISDAASPTGSTYSMTSVYVPNQRSNLVGYMDVNSDATSDRYGAMRVLRSSGPTVPGPGQVANTFANDDEVRDALLRFTQGEADVNFGNLLTLPVGGRLLYVQPVYTERSNAEASYPILQAVITSFSDRDEVGFGTSLGVALTDLLGVESPPVTPPGVDPTPVDPPPGTDPPGTDPPGQAGDAEVRELLVRMQAAFDAAEAALQQGDFAEYDRQLERAEQLLSQAVQAAQNQAAG